jgi:phenylalanyl-tRNA synthetase beta chain
VRRARDGEQIETLDGKGRALDSSMLVICDAVRPIAVAGVMGGEFSGINDNTREMVFEAASFFGPSIRVTSRKLGMRTESSARFEKGLNPAVTRLAIDRACQLVEELRAGTVVAGSVDVDFSDKTPRRLPLNAPFINALLGTDIPASEMAGILRSLDFSVDEGGTITVPSFRTDIECDADIAEEVARIHGYDKIPTVLSKTQPTQGMLTGKQKARKRIDACLVSQGLYEIQTYSFIGPRDYDSIRMPADSPLRKSVVIANPLGEDTSLMRTTTIPSMLRTLAGNFNHRNPGAALYEIGKVYLPAKEPDRLPEEREIITIGFYGNGDYYTLKGIVEALLEEFGVRNWEIAADPSQFCFHPGRSAVITAGGSPLAVLGQIHPLVSKNYDIGEELYVAAVDLALLLQSARDEKAYKPLPRFPAVERDLALITDETLPASAVEALIRKSAGNLLEKLSLFDVYKGRQIPDGKRSLAYSLVLRSDDRTLTDDEADKIISGIVSVLERELQITLRK